MRDKCEPNASAVTETIPRLSAWYSMFVCLVGLHLFTYCRFYGFLPGNSILAAHK